MLTTPAVPRINPPAVREVALGDWVAYHIAQQHPGRPFTSASGYDAEALELLPPADKTALVWDVSHA